MSTLLPYSVVDDSLTVQVDPASIMELEGILPLPQAEFCSSCQQFLWQLLAELPQELASIQKVQQGQGWIAGLGQEIFRTHTWENWQLSLLLCSDRRIATWNQEFRGIDGPTDILSFPLASAQLKKTDQLAEKDCAGGDLLLSLPSWLDNCRRFDCEPETELQRLLIHGVLHLAGLDHNGDMTDPEPALKEGEGMLQLQEYLLIRSLERRSILTR